jgi:ferrous iron transport protein B
MSSCCNNTIDYASSTVPVGTLTVALAGNPNSGKTTLFNALTGLRQKVANYPGVTVEKKTGRCKLNDGRWIDVIDLPGTYSLISRSLDEQVAMEVLRGLRKDTKPPDVVIVVVDASNLQRNLYLVSQLIELGRPLVVALNMMDVAERRGVRISPGILSQELGVPVVPIVGHKRRGIHELKDAILKAAVAPLPDWSLPDAMRYELLVVGGGLAILDSHEGSALHVPNEGHATVDNSAIAPPPSPEAADQSTDPSFKPTPPRAWICNDNVSRRIDRYEAIAERLLIGDCATDLKEIAASKPVASLLSASNSRLSALGIDPMQADIEAHYTWIDTVAGKVIGLAEDDEPARNSPATQPGEVLPYETPKPRPRNLTEKVDAILIHRVWGLLIFATIMGVLFISMFWLAQPIMDAIQSGVGALGDLITRHMTDGPIKSLITDGIFKGVGAVVVFVPQIGILFLFLAILEDSGYLARAAFLMDRLLSKVGLHGKSFIPLLSSFACAIPGIMATRTIENRKDRLATILVAPFMSCSARLPVYTLLIGTCFAAYGALTQAGMMLGLYALGILAAAGTAFVFKRTMTKGSATSFILELPSYKLPQVSQIARQVFINTRAFLTKAGTTIFCLSVILWAMAYYPRLPAEQSNKIPQLVHRGIAVGVLPITGHRTGGGDYVTRAEGEAIEREMVTQRIAAAQSEYSISGRLGHLMEPALRPLGFDWKIGIGLVSAFAAREVFVSSMGIVYSVGDIDPDKTGTASLQDAMRADHYTSGPHAGHPVWTPLVAISLLVWFVLAMQCMSTIAIVRRETGGWGWPLFMLAYMNVLAYVACLIVFQVGSLFLHG